MAEIILTAGELPPPGCGYPSEQERFEAYVASTIATLEGGIQWQSSSSVPSDVDLFWWKEDVDGRPLTILDYSPSDARYIRNLASPNVDGVPSGAANAYALTFSPAFTAVAAYQEGRRYVFVANHNNTGASTLNVDGAGPIAIVKPNGSGLDSGDISATAVVDVVIAGGFAWLQTPVPIHALTASDVRGVYTVTGEFAVPSSNAAATASHTLGVMPVIVRVVAVCKIAVDGYTVGNELDISCVTAGNGANQEWAAFTVSADSNAVTVAATQNAGAIYAAKTGGNAVWNTAVTAGSWNLKAYLL